MDRIYLSGIALKGYRSFSGTMQSTGALGAVTLFAGQNNAGKSNMLRLISRVSGKPNTQFDVLDHPLTGGECVVSIARSIDSQDIANYIPNLAASGSNSQASKDFEKILVHESIHASDDDLVWFEYDFNGEDFVLRWQQYENAAVDTGLEACKALARTLTNSQFDSPGSRAAAQNIASVMELLSPVRTSMPPVETIEAFRRINDEDVAGEALANHAGRGLLRSLQALQNPPATQRSDYERFASINRFVRNILDDENAQLEVQHDRSTLNVHHKGKVLPLEHLGTGIHQVVILAAAATVLDKHVVCIEEPEIHLHPTYQRKLIRYLSEETSNQYIIATHSAHMLDYQAATVIHVRSSEMGTEITPARTSQHLFGICADLGYRPSDLLQANAVIWVEGPSDRVYIQHWISSYADYLIEGLHYSIMFYGGRLLNCLTAEDEEVSDFIKLRWLNRNFAVVIDSDKLTSVAPLNATKQRVVKEISDSDDASVSWVTWGYTIENYIPPDLLRKSVAEVHPKAPPLTWAGGQWENPLSFKNGKGESIYMDKNRIARKVCESWVKPPLEDSDLSARINSLVDLIRKANAMP